MCQTTVTVTADPLDDVALHTSLAASSGSGAFVTFVGRVRPAGVTGTVDALELEHYPGMTERVLGLLATGAASRWSLERIVLVHRVGTLSAGTAIVFVGVASAHRHAAFEACQYLIDCLKTDAPFWKREHGPESARWVDDRDSDHLAASRWR